MSANSKTRWAILGCGKIAHKFASDFLLCDGAQLVACASRDKDKSMAFAEKYKVDQAYDSYETMLSSDNIDVVYIATPHTFHYEHSILALNHGKHVLCEKPIAINATQHSEMIKLAQKKNLFLMEAMWTAFLPMMDGLKNVLATKNIGKIKNVSAEFGFANTFDHKSRLYDLSLGGGALLDIGIYPIFITTLLLGQPTSIKSMMEKSPTGSDLTTVINMEYKPGIFGRIFTTVEIDTDTDCEIYGTKGQINIPSRFHEQEELTVTIHGQEPKTHHFPKIGLGYAHQILHVQECLRQGKTESEIMSHSLSSQLLSIMDTVRQQYQLVYPSE